MSNHVHFLLRCPEEMARLGGGSGPKRWGCGRRQARVEKPQAFSQTKSKKGWMSLRELKRAM